MTLLQLYKKCDADSSFQAGLRRWSAITHLVRFEFETRRENGRFDQSVIR